MAFEEVTPAFCSLASMPDPSYVDIQLSILEHFVVLLYDRTSSTIQVNEARKQIFTQKGRSIDSIPPTQAALIEHTKRAAYQAGHVWGQMFLPACPQVAISCRLGMGINFHWRLGSEMDNAPRSFQGLSRASQMLL